MSGWLQLDCEKDALESAEAGVAVSWRLPRARSFELEATREQGTDMESCATSDLIKLSLDFDGNRDVSLTMMISVSLIIFEESRQLPVWAVVCADPYLTSPL